MYLNVFYHFIVQIAIGKSHEYNRTLKCIIYKQ